MQHALTQKLESFETLTDEDRQALNAFVPRVRQVGAKVDLAREGDVPGNVHLILDGYACRYKVLPNGQRQILAYFLPGEFCDLNVFILDQMDHCIGTISACQVVDIPRAAIEEVTANYPRITRAFLWCALVDEAILREGLVNMGAREANQRIAHLLCELLLRLDAVGHVTDNSFAFPFTQTDLADTMGLSNVHVNRVLRELRGAGHAEAPSSDDLGCRWSQGLLRVQPELPAPEEHALEQPPERELAWSIAEGPSMAGSGNVEASGVLQPIAVDTGSPDRDAGAGQWHAGGRPRAARCARARAPSGRLLH